MQYIKNTLTYDITIKAKDGNGEVSQFGFPCLRRYSDTGNTFTTGITGIEDKDFTALKEVPQFLKMLKDGELQVTSKPAEEDAAKQLEQAEAELEELRKENDKLKESRTGSVSEEDYKKLMAENADMKSKLEALGNAGKPKKTSKKGEEAGGF